MSRTRARKIADSLVLTRARTMLRLGCASRLACIAVAPAALSEQPRRPPRRPRCRAVARRLRRRALHRRELLLHLVHVAVHVRFGHEQNARVGDLGERLPFRGIEERFHREPAHLEGLLDDAERDRTVADALERVLEIVEAGEEDLACFLLLL